MDFSFFLNLLCQILKFIDFIWPENNFIDGARSKLTLLSAPECTPSSNGNGPTIPKILPGLSVPWPGSTYVIVEITTERSICLDKDGGLYLSADPTANNRWLIVQHQGYFGFQNEQTGQYIGHDGQSLLWAQKTTLDGWESFVPRLHPNGGYHLLSPVWSHTMRFVSMASDANGLERRQDASTRWNFFKV